MRSILSAILAVVTVLAPPPLFAEDKLFVGRVIDQQSRAGVAGATVSIAGAPGTAKTDAEGRFSWTLPPTAPFQVIVILASGRVAHPVTIERFAGEPVDIPVNPLADESLTVVGAAPSVHVAPGAATTLLSNRQLSRRSPEHLIQALETVPGVNQVSEGHAAVPAIRGMARGRTLLLIDGGRVSSERRVGPSATFADPSSFEGIDVARGPGSVAYGSDALGGVISVRTRRAEPRSPLRIRGSATVGMGIPEGRGTLEVAKGFAAGGFLAQVHLREAEDWNNPEDDSEVFNSGWKDRGFLARFDHQIGRGVFSVGLQSDFARDVERPRNNSRTVRFYYPYENSNRVTSSYEIQNVGGFHQIAFTAFLGTSEQRTDQDRFATATTGRSIERADVSANDFHVKGHATRLAGIARLEFGIDVNGRYGLEALDTIVRYDTAGNVSSDTTNVSIGNGQRIDTGAYIQAEAVVSSMVRLSGGIRGDRVTSTTTGGYFGDRSTTNGAFSGFGSVSVAPVDGLNLTAQVSRGFRDPTLSDRYFRGPSGRGFITGNPDLLPETSVQFDLSARYTMSRMQFGAYVYHYRIDDLIERYPIDIDSFLFRNRGRARLRGFEVEARAELGKGFAVELGGAVGRGMALDDDAELDDVGTDTFSVLGRKDFGARGYVQLRTAVLAKDQRPGPSEIAAPGASIVDVAGGLRVMKHLELRANFRNLLDDSYFASPDPRWVHAPGRSASVTLVAEY